MLSVTSSTRAPLWPFFLLFIIYLLSIPLACIFGPMPISINDVLQLLLVKIGLVSGENADSVALLVVGDIRLTRVVLALLCGGGLAVAGLALQGVLRNSLADPFTLGVSAGAACGASIALTLTSSMTLWLKSLPLAWVFNTGNLITLFAFIGALVALFLVLILGNAKFYENSNQREGIVLAGIAVSTFLGALVALIKALNEESVTSIVFWIMGSFQGRTWDNLPLLFWPLIIGFIIIILHWRELDVLVLGQRQASELGVQVTRVRFYVLLGASLMAAACVAVAGIIAFVGLVIPHILRFFWGQRHGYLILGSWFAGGILLLWADVLAKTILSEGQELPVGIVMSLIGGPFFAFIVSHKIGKVGK